MTLTTQLLAAMALDLLLGDPRWMPHPVRGIGWLAQRLESPLRRAIPSAKAAGIMVVLLVVGATGFCSWIAIQVAGMVHPLAADVVSILLLYTTLATRDLIRHSMAVYRPLAGGDLPAARRSVSRIVGRDTAQLDETGVTRAAVESIAESTVDGVTAPLFFGLLAGPVGAMVYRAINTLDSTFGYKTERHLHFGWASARLDDLANYLPARLTAPLLGIAAFLLGRHPLQSWRILRRDGRKHESPNSGLPEAAMAGALGIELGGLNCYEGEPLPKPTIGEPLTPLKATHIPAANALMLASALIFLGLGLVFRAGVAPLLATGRPPS